MKSLSELLDLLPYQYHVWKSECMENDLGDWVCARFSEPEFEYGDLFAQGNSPEEAIIKMLEHLEERK